MIPRTLFTPEHEMFRESYRRFLQVEVAPHHARWEENGQVDRELWLKAGQAGFLCTGIPEAYGGAGGDFRYGAIVTEEMSRQVFNGPGFRLHSDIVAPYILHYGSEAQKTRWLPGMAAGRVIGAIAMTEPSAGSDLQAIRTTARREGGDYVINGAKTFISNGQLADIVVLACKTDPAAGAKGVSLILVEADRPGCRRGRNLAKIGMKAQDTSELFFDDMRVPVGNLLGEEGRGFRYLMAELPQERLLVAINAVAAAEAALGWTLEHTRDRKAFGRSLADLQTVKFKLAEMKTEIAIARVFLDRCIELHLENTLDVEAAAMAKYWLTELESRVLDQCLQLHGGYGYMLEFPIARAYVDGRVHRIYGGSNEVMLELIARHL